MIFSHFCATKFTNLLTIRKTFLSRSVKISVTCWPAPRPVAVRALIRSVSAPLQSSDDG